MVGVVMAQLAMAGTPAADGHGSKGSTPAVPAGPQPTSKQYWQARADAVLAPSVARAWALLERQASQQFAMLQGRTATADEVRAGWGRWAERPQLLNSCKNGWLQLVMV